MSMLGKVVSRSMVLDYTDIARPLTTDDIHSDIRTIEISEIIAPGEIIMWEQQWDWLVKSMGYQRRPDGGDTYNIYGLSSDHKPGQNTLFGIPVRFA